MISTELRQLLEHMAWADASVWRAVLALPVESVDDRTRELLFHVHLVQSAFLQVLRGEDPELPESDAFPSLEAIRDWGRSTHAGIGEWVGSLDADSIARPVRLPWADRFAGGAGPVDHPDVRQALLQLAAHSSHHRGQLCERIREAGGEPPLTDFVAWIWTGRPDADWGVGGPSRSSTGFS